MAEAAPDAASAAASPKQHSWLWNKDLAAIPPERRTWGTYNYTALWVAMSVNIPTYMLASGMIAGGMNWKQAIFTVFLGNVIVLIPMLLNAHAGARYGIPFPVFARASFGVLGANIPAVLRALVACGWFGIQTWIGGEAINTLLAAESGCDSERDRDDSLFAGHRGAGASHPRPCDARVGLCQGWRIRPDAFDAVKISLV